MEAFTGIKNALHMLAAAGMSAWFFARLVELL